MLCVVRSWKKRRANHNSHRSWSGIVHRLLTTTRVQTDSKTKQENTPMASQTLGIDSSCHSLLLYKRRSSRSSWKGDSRLTEGRVFWGQTWTLTEHDLWGILATPWHKPFKIWVWALQFCLFNTVRQGYRGNIITQNFTLQINSSELQPEAMESLKDIIWK